MQTRVYIKVTGLMMKEKDLENFKIIAHTQLLYISVPGRKISSKVKEY